MPLTKATANKGLFSTFPAINQALSKAETAEKEAEKPEGKLIKPTKTTSADSNLK